jgi:hypothetical protein
MVTGRSFTEMLRGILEQRIGFVADIIPAENILAGLLEEHFYGGCFQDDFYEALTTYGVPTDLITQTRNEILKSLSDQINFALGGRNPRNQYSFRFIGPDVMVTEAEPWPVFGEHVFGAKQCLSSSLSKIFGDGLSRTVAS